MSKIDNFTKEEFQQIVESSMSMREIENQLGYFGKGDNSEVIKNKCLEYGISLVHLTGTPHMKTKRTEENVFCEKSTANQTTLRRWYEKGNYTEYKCSICGQAPFWNGKALTLTLDHINGINNDDRLENLRWVCPNCDRQLDTFGSKNIHKKENYNKAKENFCLDCGVKIDPQALRCPTCAALAMRKIKQRPNRDELKELIKNKTFVEIGKIYDVSDNTIRKWCKAVNLPSRKKDIEMYTKEEWELI